MNGNIYISWPNRGGRCNSSERKTVRLSNNQDKMIGWIISGFSEWTRPKWSPSITHHPPPAEIKLDINCGNVNINTAVEQINKSFRRVLEGKKLSDLRQVYLVKLSKNGDLQACKHWGTIFLEHIKYDHSRVAQIFRRETIKGGRVELPTKQIMRWTDSHITDCNRVKHWNEFTHYIGFEDSEKFFTAMTENR